MGILGNKALREMKSTKNSQSIIITGVTGAGKTETAKHLIEFFNAEVNDKITHITSTASRILEAFGNATTVGNDNSSRFSKFVEVTECFWLVEPKSLSSNIYFP